MRYCEYCGKEINDEAMICIYCGRQLVGKKSENKAVGILSIIFGVLIGWVGLVLSVIGLCTYKETGNKRNSAIGLGLSVAWIVILILNRHFNLFSFYWW